jgi:hypothetical protein
VKRIRIPSIRVGQSKHSIVIYLPSSKVSAGQAGHANHFHFTVDGSANKKAEGH